MRLGESTLSHWGVLFLDELPEFNHTALKSLRQPLEDKVVTITRVNATVSYPASLMLVAAMSASGCRFNKSMTIRGGVPKSFGIVSRLNTCTW